MKQHAGLICLVGIAALTSSLSSGLWAQDLPPEVLAYADMVLYNGQVLTADEKFTIVEAVAVRDGKILAVGDSARILKMAGPKTERIDLRDNTVIPGFIDVHSSNFIGTHGPGGPPGTVGISFPDLDTGLRNIKERVDAAKPGDWVLVGVRINHVTRQLNRRLLDTIAPANPLLVNYALDAVVNSRALSYLPSNTPGIIKDSNGEPMGFVRGWAYGKLTYELIPWWPHDPDEVEKLLEQQRRRLRAVSRYGITTIGGKGSALPVTLVNELRKREELPVRIRFAMDFPRLNADAEGYFRRLGNLNGIGDEWVKLAGVLVMSIDGTPSRAGTLTLQPKLVEPPWAGAYGPYGESKYEMSVNDGEDWRKKSDFYNIILANRYGYNVTESHVRGDRAVEILLEAWDRANEERPIKGRAFGFVHGDMRTPEQIRRLAEYDAILSESPKYLFLQAGEGSVVEQYTLTYGADAIHRMFPVRAMIDAGLQPVIESGYTWEPGGRAGAGPPEGVTYLTLLQTFVTRKNIYTGKIWGSHQKISRQEALWMATSWAARFYQDEGIMGTIEPGKLADLVILGGDYMGVPEDKISDLPVLKTIVGGKVMYDQ